jgi:hypothetical protein
MTSDDPTDDPVEELHRVRDELWREAGGSWDAYFVGVKRREAENKERARIIPAPAPKPKDGRKGELA